MQGGTPITPEPNNGAGNTERTSEASGGLSLYIPVPGMPIGGLAIDDDDTRARFGRGARVSTRSSVGLGGAETSRTVTNRWIW
jgi:hypothetical protein